MNQSQWIVHGVTGGSSSFLCRSARNKMNADAV
jgi:hypothetical protein